MYKFVLLSAMLLVMVAGAEIRPRNLRQTEKPVIQILSFLNSQNADGSYNFEYEAEDGSKRSEQGYYKDSDKSEDGKTKIVEGSYSYVDPNGDQVKIFYTADDNGFRPHGNIIHPAIASYLQNLEVEAKEEEPLKRV